MFRTIAAGLVAGVMSAAVAQAQTPQPPRTAARRTARAAGAGGCRTRARSRRWRHGAELHQAGQDRRLRSGDGEAEGSAAEERQAGAQAAGGRAGRFTSRPTRPAPTCFTYSSSSRGERRRLQVVEHLAEAFPRREQRTLKKYAEAYAQGMNIVNLNLVADLGK